MENGNSADPVTAFHLLPSSFVSFLPAVSVIQGKQGPVQDRESPIPNQFKSVTILVFFDLMLTAAIRVSMEKLDVVLFPCFECRGTFQGNIR